MKTQALFELRDHAEGKLWPFPDRMQHLQGTDTDFNTESFTLYFNIDLAFRELQDNIAAICTKDEASRYASNVIEYLRKARYQVNQYFTGDSEYNKKLQQIETEGVSESPGSGLTPADSISGDKLEYPAEAVALYVNKICLWGEHLFTTEFIKPATEPERLELKEVNTINEKLLLLKYTGAYELLKSICAGNVQRTAALIAALTGEQASSTRTKITYLDIAHAGKESSPYNKLHSFENVLTSLRKLRIDTKKADEDYQILLSKENRDKL